MRIITRLFAWFASSIAALSALLYGAGFLVVHAHLSLLGVSGTAVPTVEYLKEGGRFVLMNLMMMYWDRSIFILLICVVPIFISIRLFAFSQTSDSANAARITNGARSLRAAGFLLGGIRKAVARCAPWVVGVVIIGTVGVSLLKLPSFFVSLSINDLLLPQGSLRMEAAESLPQGVESIPLPDGYAGRGVGVTETVISEIRNRDDTARYSRYQSLLFFFLCALSLLWFICTISFEGSGSRSILRSRIAELALKVALCFTAAIASVQLLVLPVNFGKLVVPNEFPVVLVSVADEALAQQIPPDRLFLMVVKNDEEIVLYDPQNPIWESIAMLKRNHVSGIRVLGTDKIF